MAGRVSVECPGCLAKLNLSDSTKLGKKIKCPKCSDVFVAKASDEDDDMDDLEDEEAPAKSKGGKRPAATGKRGAGKKRGGSGNDANTPIIVGAVIGVVALIGGGLFLSGMFNRPVPLAPAPVAPPMQQMAPPMAVAPPAPPPMSPTERMLALRWMPSSTEMLFHLKVSEIWQAPLLKPLLDKPETAQGVAEMRKATGMEPSDIESVTIGLSDLAGMQRMAIPAMMGMPPQATLPKFLGVIRTKKPMSLDQILSSSQEIKPADYKSKRYFETVKPENQWGGWIVDSNTMVIGQPTELKEAIDRGETVMPRKELSFADASSHLVILAAPNDPKSMRGQSPPTPPDMAPEIAAAIKALSDSSNGFALGVSIRGGVDVQTSWLLASAESANSVRTGADFAAKQAHEKFDAIKETSPPLLVELGEILLTNLKIETQSQIVKVSTSVPDSEQEKLEQLPVILTGMMMTGGLAGAMMGGGMGPAAMAPGEFGSGPNTISPGRRARPGRGGGPPGVPMAIPPAMVPAIPGMNPGGSESVDAESAEGLPDGTTLTASSSWPLLPAMTSDMKSPPTMQIMVDITGEPVGQICGYGPLNVKTLSLTGGSNLKVSKAVTIGQGNVTKTTIPFDAAEPNRMIHPDGKLRILFHVDPPSGQAKTVQTFEGSFKILTFEESDEFTIDDAPKTAKRPLADPGLKTAGVKLRVSGDGMSLSCGKDYFLGNVKVTDTANPAGPMMYAFVPESDKGQTVLKLQGLGTKLSDTLQIQFKVFRNLKEKNVSFKFANIPLPSAESKPQAPAGGLPNFGQPQN